MKIRIIIFFFLKIKPGKITRRHDFTVVNEQSRLYVTKYSFSQRTINVRNINYLLIVCMNSVNLFKNRIDKCLEVVKVTPRIE